MTDEKSPSHHMPQLDSLRAISIIGVIIVHLPVFSIWSNYLPLGLGVQLFFVISGFLITRILLNGTRNVEFIGTFYLRRALRLFPLYYIFVYFSFCISQEVRDSWPYYAFYGVNFWIVHSRHWGMATHFWSLAVEEQFYLLWPFVVLWVPRRFLAYVCSALIVTAPIFRHFAILGMQNVPMGILLLPGCTDALACGALLAILKPKSFSPISIVFACLSLISICLCQIYATGTFSTLWFYSLALPFFYVLVGSAAIGCKGIVGWILSSKPLQYVGKISYGIYVIHYFFAGLFQPFAKVFISQYSLGTVQYVLAQVGVFLVYAYISIGLAALSWKFIESPISRNRDKIILMTRHWLASVWQRAHVLNRSVGM